MSLHVISGKVFAALATVIAVSLFCTACSSGTGKEETASNEPENKQIVDVTEGREQTEISSSETDSVKEEVGNPEGQEEELEAVSEEEILEEDTNRYGSTTGNIYNDGVYAEYEDGKYFMRNREGQVFIISPAEKSGQYLAGMELYGMNYSNGKLYGILYTQNEKLKEANDQIMVVEIDDENEKFSGNVLEGRKPEYLYLVNDILFYSDRETHKLISYNPETEEEKVLVDDEIYFPNVYKDRIIFQNDADGESLYSVPLTGGEITKLNDMRSYWPIVYQDKIYYQGVGDAAYTLRCMKLDGTEDKELAGVEFQTPVLCGDKLCFVDASDFSTVTWLDLSNPDAGLQKLDIGDKLVELISNDEEIIASGTDMSNYKLYEVSNLSYINGCLMFWTVYSDENGSYIGDNAMYDFESGEADLLPYYVDTQGVTVQ